MTDRTKGILCILASAFGFALMAMFVRLADDFGGEIGCFQKSFFRNAIALVIAVTVFAARRREDPASVRLPRTAAVWAPLVLRALCGTLGIFANFYALSRVPIGEAMTLNKTAPFFTVLISWAFFGERMRLRQALTLLVAFAGVALVAKPGFAGAAAVPLLTGLVSGAMAGTAYACVHKLGILKVPGPFIVMFFSAFSCVASVPFAVCDFRPMTLAQTVILLAAGAGAAIGQFGITAAYRYAEPRSIAGFDYTSIVFSAALGFLAFGQVPDPLSTLGFVIILLAAASVRTNDRQNP